MSAPFFHARRLGDPRPVAAGLPTCPDCAGEATFEPTRKGQIRCLRHGGSGPLLSAAVSEPDADAAPVAVERIRGRRALGCSPLGGGR